MLRRLLFTIATAACLTGLYAVYAVIARPLVVAPELPESSFEPTKHAVAHRPAENVRVADTYLAELRWAAKSQYTLRSGQAFIYTDKWAHEENSPWIQFEPFAMVWLQKDGQGNEQAISLVSDSAQVKFASSFDTINPNPGRVVSAVLEGTVQVKGPDGLAIAGKQFIFDESAPSLVSTYPVQFEYGSHSGEGRSLNVKLIPAEGLPRNDRPHVYGIQTVRLDGGPHPTKGYMHAKMDLRIPQGEQTRLVHIQCERDLELDVLNHTMKFSKKVRARSPVSRTQQDELECDELLMEFQPVDDDVAKASQAANDIANASTREPGKDLQHFSSELTFKRLTASGREVKVKSAQNHLEAWMQRMVFDAAEHKLKLTDSNDVIISQQRSRLTVPDVEVHLPDDNSLPPRVVWCRGKGRLDMRNEDSNSAAFVATWTGYLRKSTDAATGLDLIELQQKASFRQPSQSTALGAELIRLWLDPIPMSGLSGTTEDQKSPPVEPKPKRLVAEREVALFSPQLWITRTNELDVRFENVAAPKEIGLQSRTGLQQVSLQEQPESDSSPKRHGKAAVNSNTVVRGANPARSASHASLNRRSRIERGSLGEAIEIPGSDGTTNRTGATDTVNDSKPPELTADRIVVRMQNIEGQSQPELADVETNGHVKISRRNGPGEAPMTATGDRLRLQRNGESREIVHLFGGPAHLRDRGMHIEGREIHLDVDTNRVWVKGHGLLQLPVPPGAQIASLGQASSDPDLDVWWDESMEFDGRTAKFVGKVLAELGLSKLWCEQMDVRLASTISFSEPAPESRPSLKSILCRENVSFQSSQWKDNNMVHVVRGRVAELAHDHEQGISNAQGPGQIQVCQRSKKRDKGPQRQQSEANRPMSAVTTDWDYTRIDFKGRMTGNIVMYGDEESVNQQTSRFHNSVTIVYGPVSRPNDTIDVDHLPAEAGSMRCEELEFSHHAKGPDNAEPYQTMIGTINAQVEGRGFYANADEISFDGSKKLYILRAWGNQEATITHYSPNGKKEETSSRRIEFIPELKRIRADRFSGASR